MKKNRFLFLIVFFSFIMYYSVPFTAEAAKSNAITSTVNLVNVNENITGDGYYWANIDKILTLTNVNINTKDEYGLKLPVNATIVLEGKNYISASNVAVFLAGRVTIEGGGSLTITSGDTGIVCASVNKADTFRIRKGTVNINSKNTGIYSQVIDISILGGKTNINISEPTGYAVNGISATMTAGTFTANAPISLGGSITISGTNLSINANSAAISAQNGIIISSSEIKAGANANSMSLVENYNSENSVTVKSNVKRSGYGILFKSDYPIFVDYIVFLLILGAAFAVIALPIYYKRKKTKALIQKYQQEKQSEKSKLQDSKTQNSKNKL